MADQFTHEQRERLLRVAETLSPDRLSKAVACLDEMESAAHARGIVIGIKDIQAALRFVQWMRWTRQGAAEAWKWIAGAVIVWVFFEDQIRAVVQTWLAGQ